MNRKIVYQCENCGRVFSSQFECQIHESDCKDLTFLADTYTDRLTKYIALIESKGLIVSGRSYNGHLTVFVREDYGRLYKKDIPP